jgi:nucleoside phosphorylase
MRFSSHVKIKPHKISTLIVGANAAELAPFFAGKAPNISRRHFVIRGDFAYLAAGIGPVAATFGLTHFLEDYRPRQIIAIGTAGAINTEKLAIGDVLVTKSVSTNAKLADVYTPRLQCATIKLKATMQKGTIKYGSVFCPQDITCTESRRAALARAGHDAENLESFAYAFVAQRFLIPCTIYLGISNNVGERAHAEWKMYGAEVLRGAVERVTTQLHYFE